MMIVEYNGLRFTITLILGTINTALTGIPRMKESFFTFHVLVTFAAYFH